MRNVYHVKQYFRINGKEWQRTGYGNIVYVEDSVATEQSFEGRVMTDFDEICDIVDKYIWNSESRMTIFGNKVLNLWDMQMYGKLTYRRKEIKTFEVKVEYTRRNDFHIRGLAQELSADDFCEYLKDRGVQNIIIS